MSLAAKYLSLLALSLVLIWLATLTLGEFMIGRAVQVSYDDQLIDLAQSVAAELRADPAQSAQSALVAKEALRMLADRHDRLFYALRDARGALLAGDVDLQPAVLRDGEEVDVRDGVLHERPVRVVTLLIDDDGRESRFLQLAVTRNKRDILVGELRKESVLAQSIVLIAALLLVAAALLYGLVPIRRLQRSIDLRDSHDLAPLELSETPGEFRSLIQSINALMARLEGRIAAQRRFVADAAHQLRTPLAGLKSQIERARSADCPEPVRSALTGAAAGADRSIALANRLLTLARVDAGPAMLAAPVDLVTLASEAIGDHLDAANERGQDLGLERCPPGSRAHVVGDALLLREMVSNLIENAIRYTPCGGAITVRVTAATGTDHPRLAIVDTGPGVPVDDRERVFEPFYRGADVEVPGTGLGLAIVRSIANAHGANVAVADGDSGGGLCVEVWFAPVVDPR